MDQEIARLDRQGTAVDFSERIIGGFPLGYEVTVKDVAVGFPDANAVYRFPEIVTRADLMDVTRLTTDLPPTFSLEFDPGAAAGTLPEDGGGYKVDFEAESAQIVLVDQTGGQRTVTATADSLLAVFGSALTESQVAVEFKDLNAESEIPGAIAPAQTTSKAEIGFVDYVIKTTAETGANLIIEGQVEDLRTAGSSSIRTAADFAALMDGESEGKVDLTVSTGKTVNRIHSGGTADQAGGTLTNSSGTSSSVIGMQDGALTLRGEARTTSIEIAPEGDTPFETATISLDMLDLIYNVPFAPSREMQPFDLKLALVGLGLDETLWGLVDPGETLDRAPAELLLDAEGTMRLTKPQSDVRPGEAPPVAFGNLSINKADLRALGAKAKASGDVEFLQPINLPQGAITVRLDQVPQVIEKLVASGVLTPDVLLFSSLMIQTYTTPDPETGELVAEVEMGPEGLKVNGQPLQ